LVQAAHTKQQTKVPTAQILLLQEQHLLAQLHQLVVVVAADGIQTFKVHLAVLVEVLKQDLLIHQEVQEHQVKEITALQVLLDQAVLPAAAAEVPAVQVHQDQVLAQAVLAAQVQHHHCPVLQ
jgi:hypothetical protein